MATTIFCPLNPSRLALLKWGSNGLGRRSHNATEEIESHVKSSTTCCHPPLKDLVLAGFLEGSTPLLMACQMGNIVAVDRILECWRADVNRAAVLYIPHTGFKLERVTP